MIVAAIWRVVRGMRQPVSIATIRGTQCVESAGVIRTQNREEASGETIVSARHGTLPLAILSQDAGLFMNNDCVDLYQL